MPAAVFQQSACSLPEQQHFNNAAAFWALQKQYALWPAVVPALCVLF
jgi:hypothetical protein